MKKNYIFVTLALLILLGGGSGIYLYKGLDQNTNIDKIYIDKTVTAQAAYSGLNTVNSMVNVYNTWQPLKADVISTGNSNTCAVLEEGTVQCWGPNEYGQLGVGGRSYQVENNPYPKSIQGLIDVVDVQTDGTLSCALLVDHTVKCWGDVSIVDATHYNSWEYQLSPVLITGLPAVKTMAIGRDTVCFAMLNTDEVKCFDRNHNQGVMVSGLSGTISSLTIGVKTCVLDNQIVKCWNDINNPIATPLSPSITNATSVSSGGVHSCALLSTGGVKCWGLNSYGQLGDGTYNNSSTPITVTGINSATAISAGSYHTCATLANNTMKCWGRNSYGQLGNGTQTSINTPILVPSEFAFKAVSAGGDHTCGIDTEDRIACWGRAEYGSLGNRNTTNNQYYPVGVADVDDSCNI